ncbi:MAG: alpha-hydroxy acid oxidase [Gammaproteobacteria bacterium]|nr:alpha-hydroxy acid oxidase [Gammaproteobacteria bacterium]
MFSKITSCKSIYDLRERAIKRLPRPIYYYLECGSDDEYSYKNNTAAFDNYHLVPDVLNDVSKVNMSTRLLGCDIDLPLILSPTGMTRMFHPEGELAVIRAAEKFGVLYTASIMASYLIHDMAAASKAPKMFQLYVVTDHGLNEELIEQARAGGFNALCLTVDTVVGGKREAVEKAGMTVPPSLTLKSALQFAIRPKWLWDYYTNPPMEMVNLVNAAAGSSSAGMPLAHYVRGLLKRKLTWGDAEQMIKRWNGPFVIKGVLSIKDAKQAVNIGATAIMISNHGGRQLDGTPAPIQLVTDIRDAVGDKIEVIVDGGIRRGTHILKALALGATACSIGRPYLYGLAMGGQAGVERALKILRDEVKQGMTLLGCNKINDVTERHIRELT